MSDHEFQFGDRVNDLWDGLGKGTVMELDALGDPKVRWDSGVTPELYRQARSLEHIDEPRINVAISPSHYKVGDVEVIDLTKHMGFLDGNVVKYVTRYKQKNGVEDLYKARKYLDWLIEQEESHDPNNAD